MVQQDAGGEKKNSDPIGGIAPPLPQAAIKPATSVAPDSALQALDISAPVQRQQPLPAEFPVVPPQPAPTPAPPVIAVATPAPKAAPARKLSRGLLDDMDDDAGATEKRIKELTLAECQQLFEAYKQGLLEQSKNMLHGQFAQMRVEFYPPDEVCIISPSELTDSYARENRGALIDFFRAGTQLLVRVVTRLVEDEAVKAAQQNTVLSKSEMYEAMAQKNPYLAKLKEALNMQIDY